MGGGRGRSALSLQSKKMQQTPSSWQLHRLNICQHTASRCNPSGHKDQHGARSHRDLLGFLASAGDVELEAGAGLRSLAQHRAQSAAVAGVALRAEDPVAVLEHNPVSVKAGHQARKRRRAHRGVLEGLAAGRQRARAAQAAARVVELPLLR